MMKLPWITAIKSSALIAIYCFCRLSTGLETLMYDKELRSSIAYFNKIHNTSLTESGYREKFRLLPGTKYYNFIFGFSTGHVGTKSLSEAKLYGLESSFDEDSVARIGFEGMFQRKFGMHIVPTDHWVKYNQSDEFTFVQDEFIPFMQNMSFGRPTAMDLGHHTLYFYHGLVKYLTENTNFSFAFVRIRRERIETASSLLFSTPGNPWRNLCHGLSFRVCPQDRTEDVQLPIPKHVWSNFTNFQQALWMVDEVEARWKQLKKQYPNMVYREVLWGKKWPDSFVVSANTVSRLLGLNKTITQEEVDHRPHGEHVGNTTILDVKKQLREDAEYNKIMRSYVPNFSALTTFPIRF